MPDLVRPAAELQAYDQLDLFQRLAVMNLMTENASNSCRLDLAASALLTLEPRSEPGFVVSDHRWTKWFKSTPVSSDWVRRAEDPCCNPFVDEIAFFGGSYRLMPGQMPESSHSLRALLRAIFANGDDLAPLSEEFLSEAHDATLLALTLSDRCIRPLGDPSALHPRTSPSQTLFQPPRGQLERLRPAVTISDEELGHLAGRLRIGTRAFDALISLRGTDIAVSSDLEQLPVYDAPFVRVRANVVVLAPSSIPMALTRHLVRLAVAAGQSDALAARFRRVVFENVMDSLDLLGSRLMTSPHAVDRMPGIAADFSLDTDKLLTVLVLSDPLSVPFSVSEQWERTDLGERINDWIAEQEVLATARSGLNGLAILVVIASPCRSQMVGLSASRFARTLLLTAEALEVIAQSEPGHQLLLWQYADSSERIREHARVFSFDPLDEFSYWRNNRYSYYSSDDGVPNAIMIDPGTAMALRTEARERSGRRGILASDGVSIAEVIRFHGPDVPVFAIRPEPGRPLEIAVDQLAIPLWVRVPRPLENSDTNHAHLLYGLADFASYWLWQFTSFLTPRLQRLGRTHDVFILDIVIAHPELWAKDGNSGRPLEISPSEHGITATFYPGAVDLFYRGDNSGERVLVRQLLQAIDTISFDDPSTRSTEEELDLAIDRFAPLGPKKKMPVFRNELALMLNEHGLPRYRPLQMAVLDAWRDQEWPLLERLGLSEGVVPRAQRVSTLNALVDELFGVFERLVASLNPDRLLDWLIAQDERLAQRQRHTEQMLPAQIECFGSAPAMLERLRREGPELATTAISHRFLIEYVVAQPPAGPRPFSVGTYDELIALAAYLVGTALDSDAIRYDLADTQIRVLPSHRLGRSVTSYSNAIANFLDRTNAAQIEYAQTKFASHWDAPGINSQGDPPIGLEEFSAATRAEFGLSLQDVADFLSVLVAIGETQDGVVKRMPLAELRPVIESELQWPATQLDAAFALLTQRPRDSFLNVPSGFLMRDVFPWRFGRRLSYLMRPLLIRNDDVFWGTRAVLRANDYLFNHIADGRYEAHSPELQALRGRMTNISGHAFNERVATRCRALQYEHVRSQVTEIGGRRVERARSEPLGDVDVLAIDQLNRCVLAVETKDFSMARNPAEFRSEGQKLAEAPVIHEERVGWLRANLQHLLTTFGIHDDAALWIVHPLVVVAGEPFTPFLAKLPMEVRALRDITARDLSPVRATRRQTVAGGKRRKKR